MELKRKTNKKKKLKIRENVENGWMMWLLKFSNKKKKEEILQGHLVDVNWLGPNGSNHP